jgi:hypothetical protein
MALILSGAAGSSTLDSSTGLAVATWTTGTRPSSPVAGQMGYNSTTGYPEWYDATSSTWVQFNSGAPYSVDYLIIAGGGGGGGNESGGTSGGGGGAGGYRTSSVFVTTQTSYAITV